MVYLYLGETVWRQILHTGLEMQHHFFVTEHMIMAKILDWSQIT